MTENIPLEFREIKIQHFDEMTRPNSVFGDFLRPWRDVWWSEGMFPSCSCFANDFVHLLYIEVAQNARFQLVGKKQLSMQFTLYQSTHSSTFIYHYY